MQLLLNFELRDCCGCCTFGDLPSFSLGEGIWRQEKEKKKRERERGRERKGGGLYCVLWLFADVLNFKPCQPHGHGNTHGIGISLHLETPLPCFPLPTAQGELNTQKRLKRKYPGLPASSSLWKVIWPWQAGVRAKHSLPTDSTQKSPAWGVRALKDQAGGRIQAHSDHTGIGAPKFTTGVSPSFIPPLFRVPFQKLEHLKNERAPRLNDHRVGRGTSQVRGPDPGPSLAVTGPTGPRGSEGRANCSLSPLNW